VLVAGCGVFVAGCGGHHTTVSPLERAVEQRGFDPELARCVATSAEGQLGKATADHLATLLDHLPPDAQASLTKLTAACAVTPPTTTAPTTVGSR
jgi:hypothetical protein